MEPAAAGALGAVLGAAFAAIASYLAARRNAGAVEHSAELNRIATQNAADLNSRTAIRVAEIQAETTVRAAYIAAQAAYQSALLAQKATEALDPSAKLPELPEPPEQGMSHYNQLWLSERVLREEDLRFPSKTAIERANELLIYVTRLVSVTGEALERARMNSRTQRTKE